MELDPPVWPTVWHSVDFVEQLGGNSRPRSGARVTIGKKDSKLTYHCVCGETFTRARQELVVETREWVKLHTPHLPPEEQVDG